MSHPRIIPHAFKLYGHTWRVVWRNPDDGADPDGTYEELATVSEAERLVTIHPKLRRDREKAAKVFLHEVLHIVDWRQTRRKVRGWLLTERDIDRLDEAVGGALYEMGVVFPCVCLPCRRKLERVRGRR